MWWSGGGSVTREGLDHAASTATAQDQTLRPQKSAVSPCTRGTRERGWLETTPRRVQMGSVSPSRRSFSSHRMASVPWWGFGLSSPLSGNAPHDVTKSLLRRQTSMLASPYCGQEPDVHIKLQASVVCRRSRQLFNLAWEAVFPVFLFCRLVLCPSALALHSAASLPRCVSGLLRRTRHSCTKGTSPA